jgi:hypothetical protein
MKTLALGVTVLASAWSLSALAYPVAQLDASGGTWDPTTQSIVTTNSQFTLYGYGNTPLGNGKALDLSLDWRLSVSLIPQTTAGTNFGSFKIGTTSYDTTDFLYGVPPVETMLTRQPGDLQTHSVFPTLFMELDVDWLTGQTRAGVDVQTTAGTNPTANPGNALYWLGWNFDVSGLLAGYQLHFDLYGVTCTGTTTTNCAIQQFAPFSHDAETNVTNVPEPATVTLLGAGLLLLGASVRRRSAKLS